MTERDQKAATRDDETHTLATLDNGGAVMLAAGSKLGPYEIVSSLGAGAMGEVYRARDPRLDREVAIKIVASASVTDASRLRRFQEEARATGQLNHPNILSVYDVGADGAVPYIVSELLEGETLRSRLAHGSVGLDKAVDWTCQMVAGLTAAHDKGIVHRDLKPDNVFVTTDGRIKILDFGLAKLTRPGEDVASASHWERATETIPGTVLGTNGYMSPEQVRGQPADSRSDLFTVGAILWEMLTGRPAFIRASPAETMTAILREDVEVSPDVPHEIGHIIRHCLEKNPNQRFQTARDLLFGLQSQLVSSGADRRRPMVWVLSALAVLAASGLLVSFLMKDRSVGGTAIGAAGRPAVAVMSFDNPSGAADIAWLTDGIPSMLVTGLAQTKGLDVISNSRLEEVAKAAGYGDVAHLDRARWREVARRAGAGALVGGSIFNTGGNLRLDVRVEDVASGRVISAHALQGPDVFPLVDDVTLRIVTRVGVATSGMDTQAIAEMTTPSVEAYRLYSEALVARKNLRTADARELLEKAVALDPGFALAYMDLAIATNLLKDDAATRRYEAAALEHLDRLPPRQRLLVQLTTARTAGEPRKAIGFGERLVEQFPDEGEGFHMLAHAYGDLNDSAQSLRTWEKAIRVLPEAGNLRNEYGYALLDAGRYDEALRELEEYRRLNPREPNPYDSLGEARLVLGEPELALESYGTALTIDPQFFDSHVGRALALSMRGRYSEALAEAGLFASALGQRKAPMARGELLRGWLLSRVGRYREAEAAIDRSRVEAVRVVDGEGQTAADLAAAVIALERGQLKPAQDMADRALARVSGLREPVRGPARAAIQFVAGVAEIRAGGLEAARRRLGGASPPDVHPDRIEVWWRQALAAEVAVASGSVSEAEVALAAAPRAKMWFSLSQASLPTLTNSLSVRDTVARVQVRKGDLAGAITTYRELLTRTLEHLRSLKRDWR